MHFWSLLYNWKKKKMSQNIAASLPSLGKRITSFKKKLQIQVHPVVSPQYLFGSFILCYLEFIMRNSSVCPCIISSYTIIQLLYCQKTHHKWEKNCFFGDMYENLRPYSGALDSSYISSDSVRWFPFKWWFFKIECLPCTNTWHLCVVYNARKSIKCKHCEI